MQDYKVVLTWEAIYDVTDIASYIEAKFGQLQADRFQNDIENEMKKLGYMGGIFPKTQILYVYNNFRVHLRAKYGKIESLMKIDVTTSWIAENCSSAAYHYHRRSDFTEKVSQAPTDDAITPAAVRYDFPMLYLI